MADKLAREPYQGDLNGESVFSNRVCCPRSFIMALALPAYAAAPYYEGKTIRLIVGFSAGGGFDTYSRLIARHLGKHIPGDPAIVVENMTGAASLVAANHVYNVAKPDGLTILNFHGNQVINQMIGKPGIEFDARKFEYIGIPTQDNVACAFTKASGITTFDSAEKRQDAGETRRRRAGGYNLQHREASDCRT